MALELEYTFPHLPENITEKDTSPLWTYNGSPYGVSLREAGSTVVQSYPTAQGAFHSVNTSSGLMCLISFPDP